MVSDWLQRPETHSEIQSGYVNRRRIHRLSLHLFSVHHLCNGDDMLWTVLLPLARPCGKIICCTISSSFL